MILNVFFSYVLLINLAKMAFNGYGIEVIKIIFIVIIPVVFVTFSHDKNIVIVKRLLIFDLK